MKRILIAAVFSLAALAGLVGVRPAQAAPPGPQCGSVIACDPIDKIGRICQNAYCWTP